MANHKYSSYALFFLAIIVLLVGVGHALTGSGSATQVAFFTDNYTISSDSNLYWNNVTGRLGIGTDNPQGALHISSDNDSMPSLIMDKETLGSKVINGSMEFDGNTLWFTKQGARKAVQMTDASQKQQLVVSNTSSEVTIINNTLKASELEPGKIFVGHWYGSYDTATSSDMFTLRYYLGGDLLASASPALKNVDNAPIKSKFVLTVYNTTGPNGSRHVATYLNLDLDRVNKDVSPVLTTINTSEPNDLVVTVDWGSAKPGNVLREQQQYLEVIN